MPGRYTGEREIRWLRLVITPLAAVVAAAHIAFPRLQIDAVLLGLLVLAILPWLGGLIDSLELPGGWKLQYRRLEERVAEVRGNLSEVSGQVSSASLKADAALVALTPPRGQPTSPEAEAHARLMDAVQEYDQIRAMQPSGPARTQAETQVLREMLSLARSLANFDWPRALESEDPGTRLAAYAVLYTWAVPDGLEPLVRTLTRREDKPFNQYWAIQTLGRIVANRPTVPPEVTSELEAFLLTLRPDLDRHYELSRLLRSIRAASPG